MLSHFKTAQLQQVVDIIVKASAPEKVFLLGAAHSLHTEETIFMQPPVTFRQVIQYYLLVLTRIDDKRCFDALQDAIENRCQHATPVTVFIEAAHIFNEWINEAHPFACHIAKAGLLLYDAGNIPLNTPLLHNPATEPALLQKEFTRWDTHVTEFLAGTELYRLRKQFGLAAFLLHQAAEHACTILFKMITGYRAGTHNLDKLLRYCRPLSAELAMLFPRTTEKENNLFQLLQKAYVHARYRDDYMITEKELRLLTERVKKLQLITREIAEARVSLSQ